ncbi:MAG: hypothetical protein SFZ24_03625 [Planctomycetota bacterium]|nr:hypothetical protein [Planctomycetota bacterium]
MPATPGPPDVDILRLAHPHRASGPLASRPGAEYDAIADMFLDGPDTRSAPAAAPTAPHPAPARAPEPPLGARGLRPHHLPAAPRPTLELLVQGHLPVRAAPWSAQFARVRAETTGQTVALVRFASGSLAIDLFTPRPRPQNEPPLAHADEAIARALSSAQRIILQLDELDQAAACEDPRVSAVTVLAGGNEAAVVAAYRTLKAVLVGGDHAADLRAARGESAPPAPGVALVGVGPDDAERVMTKLRHAAALFLGSTLELAAVVEKVAPTGALSLYRGPTDLSPPALLDRLSGAAPAPAPAPGRTTSPDPQPAPRAANTPGATAPAPGTVDASAPALAPLLGYIPLAPACPDDPRIELAVDALGGLHLLTLDEDDRGFERLALAARWARRHIALLAAAARPHTLSLDRPITPHLFVRDARAARRLVDADVRVHALVPASATPGALDLN